MDSATTARMVIALVYVVMTCVSGFGAWYALFRGYRAVGVFATILTLAFTFQFFTTLSALDIPLEPFFGYR